MSGGFLEFPAIGIMLGLSAGFAPGPLMALVISETLRHGFPGGVKVALAPLITDLPIIVVSLLFLDRVAGHDHILGAISIFGGVLVTYLGYRNLRVAGIREETIAGNSRSLGKGVLVNFLSPHPYLFWFGIGGPLTYKAAQKGVMYPLLFVLSFYLLLVASKVFLALLVTRSSTFITGCSYLFTVKSLGLLMIAFSLVLFHDGLKLLGYLS